MAPSSSSTALVVASTPDAPAAAATAVDDDDDVDLPVDLSQLPRIPPAKTLLLVTNFVANTTRFLNHFAGDCEARLAQVSAGLTRVEILLAILEAKLDSIPDLAVSDAQVDAAARAISGDAPLAANGESEGPSLGIDSEDLPDAGAAGFVPPPPPPPPGAPFLGEEGEVENRLVVGGGLPPPPPPPPGLPSFDGDDESAELSSALVLAPSGELETSGLFGDDAGPPVLKLKDDPIYVKYFTMRRLGIPDPVIEQKLMLDGMDPSILSMDPEGPSPSAGVGSASSSGLPSPPPPPPGPPQPPSGNIGLPFPPPPPPISPTSSTSSRAESLFSAPTHPPPPPPDLFPATGPPLPPMPDHDESSSDDEEEFEADPLPAQPGFLKLKDDPAFTKYFTMRKLGMPDGVIQHKLMMDGVTLDILSMDPEGPSPNGGAGAPPASNGGPSALPPPPQGLPPPPVGRPGLPPPPMPKYDDDFDSDSD